MSYLGNSEYYDKYVKYKNKYINLKNQIEQIGGFLYDLNLCEPTKIKLEDIFAQKNIVVKLEDIGVTFDIVKKDTITYRLTSIEEVLGTNSGSVLVIEYTKIGDLINGKLSYIRAGEVITIGGKKDYSFSILFDIFLCLSKRIGAVKLELDDQAIFFDKITGQGYSALLYRLFEGKKGLYSSRESSFKPKFNAIIPNYEVYENMIKEISNTTFGFWKSFLYHAITILNYAEEKIILETDLNNIELSNKKFSEYLALKKHQYVRTLLNLFTRKYEGGSKKEQDVLAKMSPEQLRIQKNISVIFKMSQELESTESSFSCRITCLNK